MKGHRIFSTWAHAARSASVLTLSLALTSCTTSPTGRAQFARHCLGGIGVAADDGDLGTALAKHLSDAFADALAGAGDDDRGSCDGS